MRRRPRGRRHLRAIAISTIVVGSLGVSAVAWAWFRHAGSGTASATTSKMLPVTVAALTGGDAPSTALFPGGTADVVLRISNPNTYAVKLVSVAANGVITGSGGVGACPTTGVVFSNQTGLSNMIPATGTAFVNLPSAASMSAASSSGCQGATFAIPIAVTVRGT